MLVSAASLLSQDVWNEGYIIKEDGTLLTGQILIDKKSDVSELCTFRRFDIADKVTYAPSELKAFAIYDGPYYESHPDGNIKKFYRCVIRGKVSLFALGKRLFLNAGDNELILLDKDYSKTLIGILSDNPATVVPEKLRLDEEEISDLIANYNANKGSTSVRYSDVSSVDFYDELMNKGGIRSVWGPIVGGYISFFEVNKEFFMFEMTGFHPDLTAGLFFNYRLFPKTRAPEVQIEALLRKSTLFSCIEEEGKYTTRMIRTYTNCDFTGIKVPVLFRFKMKGEALNFFGNIGASFSYVPVRNFTTRTETEYTSGVVRSESVSSDQSVDKYQFTGLIGAGLQYTITPEKKIAMEFRAEYGSGIFYTNTVTVLDQHSETLGIYLTYSF